MRRFTLMIAALCGLTWFAADARAENQSPFRLLDSTPVANSSMSVPVTPVRIGTGWRGYGWYPGWGRPYGSYYNGPYYAPPTTTYYRAPVTTYAPPVTVAPVVPAVPAVPAPVIVP